MPLQLVELEEELLLLQSVTLEDFSKAGLSEASIKVNDDGETVAYRLDVLWYYLYMIKMPGTNRSKFENLLKMAKIVLAIVHSNAECSNEKEFDPTMSKSKFGWDTVQHYVLSTE